MGYSPKQRQELLDTIHACCNAEDVACVVDACPGRLERAIDLDVPVARVSYAFRQIEGPSLLDQAMGLINGTNRAS
jgi:predicted GTPase